MHAAWGVPYKAYMPQGGAAGLEWPWSNQTKKDKLNVRKRMY